MRRRLLTLLMLLSVLSGGLLTASPATAITNEASTAQGIPRSADSCHRPSTPTAPGSTAPAR